MISRSATTRWQSTVFPDLEALTVALLPLLGVGGFQLIKAETTGPEKGKITPKITTTAKLLWIIYLVFTVLEAVLLRIFGMDTVDAISHAFSTLGTGGFSSMNNSIGGYNSASIDVICTVFMFFAGVNFSLYYYAVTGRYSEIKDNSELKAYVSVFVVPAAFAVILPFWSMTAALVFLDFHAAPSWLRS